MSRIWVSALQTMIMASFHASVIGGHSWAQATYYRGKALFQWKGMKQSVVDFVQQCDVYQRANNMNTHPACLLQPLPIPEGAWKDISMDFIEGLPKSEGYTVILVAVDRFTKYAHFIAVEHPYTTKSIALLFFHNVVNLHGLPKTMVSDGDKILKSHFWTELFNMVGTKLLLSSVYQSHTDGRINAWRCTFAVWCLMNPRFGNPG